MTADLNLLSVNALMDKFDCSRSTIYNMEKSGELPPRILVGKSWKWRHTDIQDYLESRRNVSAPKRIVGKNKNSNSSIKKTITNKENRTSSLDERSIISTIKFNKQKSNK